MKKIKLNPIAKAELEKGFKESESLVKVFFERAEKLGNKPFLWAVDKNGKYRAKSWREVAEEVKALAFALQKLGLKKGDRAIILSENRPEWCISDIAIMAAGGITVPVYTTNTSANHQHIFKDCDAHIVIASTKELASKMFKGAVESFWSMTMITIEPMDIQQSEVVHLHLWDKVMADAKVEMAQNPEAFQVYQPKYDDVACLIYTSGTGGAPKGVMLTHHNMIANLTSAVDVIFDLNARMYQERFFSILPLSHAYEHTCGQMFAILVGSQIYYMSGMDKLMTEVQASKPTILIAVPRLFEVVKLRMNQAMRRKGEKAVKLFNRTVELGAKKIAGQSLSPREKIEDLALEFLVRRKIRANFGGHIKAFVAGGAALSSDIGDFFQSVGMPILQGYGQTEASPLISCNMPSCCDYTTVGRPLKDIEVKFALDGEILIRGEMVMKGYWNNPEATAAAVDESGWLHTGDIGELDAEGRIKITDRKKDIIVNSGGDNISPLRVESIITLEDEISQCLIYGDKQSHLVALIVPAADFIKSWAKENGVEPDLETLSSNPAFEDALFAVVERANKNLSIIEKVRKIKVAREPFTVENAMMTPTLKVRRGQVKKVYEEELLGLYRKK